MKTNKNCPTKGSKIYIVETYTESKAEQWGFYNDTVYYIDTKKRKVWMEEGIDLTPILKQRGEEIPENIETAHNWVRLQSHRSLKELVNKYESDFNRFLKAGYIVNIEATEIGVL